MITIGIKCDFSHNLGLSFFRVRCRDAIHRVRERRVIGERRVIDERRVMQVSGRDLSRPYTAS